MEPLISVIIPTYNRENTITRSIDSVLNQNYALSTKAEELSKALHAGIIPEAYKAVIEDIEVKEVRRLVKDELDEPEIKSIYGTEDEMVTRAKEGYFVRDLVYCPNEEALRQKVLLRVDT